MKLLRRQLLRGSRLHTPVTILIPPHTRRAIEQSSDRADVRGGVLADCAQSLHGSPPHLPIAILEQSSDRADLRAA